MGSVGMVFQAQLRHRWRSWLAITILISLVGGVVMAAAAAGQAHRRGHPEVRGSPRLRRRGLLHPARTGDRPTARGHIGHARDRPRQRPAEVRLHPSDRSVQLRGGHPQDRRERGLQSGVGPTAGSFEPPRGGGLVHAPTRRGGAAREHHQRPVLQSVASVGRQRCHRGSASAHGPDGGPSGGRVRGDGVRLSFWRGPRLPPVGLPRLHARGSSPGRGQLPLLRASPARRGRSPSLRCCCECAGPELDLRPERGRPGRIGRSVGAPPGDRLVAAGSAGRPRRARGRRAGTGASEHRRERGIPDVGRTRPGAPAVGRAGQRTQSGGGARGCRGRRGHRHPALPDRSAGRGACRRDFDRDHLRCARPDARRARDGRNCGRARHLACPCGRVGPHAPATRSSMRSPRSCPVFWDRWAHRQAWRSVCATRSSGGAAGPTCRWAVRCSARCWRWWRSAGRRCSAPASRTSPRRRSCTEIPSSSTFRTRTAGAPDPTVLRSLEHDRAVTGLTQGIALPAITIGKVVVGALAGTAVRGSLLMSTVDGHSPDAKGEVGLGGTTMRAVGARVGSVVDVTVSLPSGARGRRRFEWSVRCRSP